MARYYVITATDDGVRMRSFITPEQVLKHLEDCCIEPEEAFDSLPDGDPGEWGKGALIIKGEVVWPHAVRVVTEYKLP